jgi:glycogen(starch) synthase
MVDILVLVNNEFRRDSRVRRLVEFLGQKGYSLAVASGTTDVPDRGTEDHPWGKLYRFRTLKAGQVSWLQPLVRFAIAGTEGISSSGEVDVPEPGLSWPKRLLKHLLYAAQLLNLLLLNLRLVLRFHSLPAGLYYANDFDTIGAAATLAWLRRKPFVYDTHELYVDQTTAYPAWYRRVLLFLEGRWARQADAVITVGECIARVIHERYQLDAQPTFIMNCPPYQSVVRELNSGCPFRLLYHGGYWKGQGVEQLILAMHHVNGAHLYLRGLGYLEKPLRDLAHREGLESKVTFLPPVPMDQLVREAAPFDIGVSAVQGVSLNGRYCLPNKVFEYMMAGLALAVSDLPELRRIVNDHGIGVTFDSSNPSDIARQINDLLANPERLGQMRANALRAAREVFNFEREGEKLLQIVGDLLGPPSAVGR